jgi:hypothetical protein
MQNPVVWRGSAVATTGSGKAVMRRARRVDRSAATSTFARATSAEQSGFRKEKRLTGTMLSISGNSFLKTSTSESAQTILHFEKIKVRSCSRTTRTRLLRNALIASVVAPTMPSSRYQASSSNASVSMDCRMTTNARAKNSGSSGYGAHGCLRTSPDCVRRCLLPLAAKLLFARAHTHGSSGYGTKRATTRPSVSRDVEPE